MRGRPGPGSRPPETFFRRWERSINVRGLEVLCRPGFLTNRAHSPAKPSLPAQERPCYTPRHDRLPVRHARLFQDAVSAPDRVPDAGRAAAEGAGIARLLEESRPLSSAARGGEKQ